MARVETEPLVEAEASEGQLPGQLAIPAGPVTIPTVPPQEPPDPALTWTAEQASQYFERAGLPIDAGPLLAILKALKVPRAGRTPSGEKGGRGKALYSTAVVQRLHRDLTDGGWITPRDPPAGGQSRDG